MRVGALRRQMARLRSELAAAIDELDQRLDLGDELPIGVDGRAAAQGERVVATFRRVLPVTDPAP